MDIVIRLREPLGEKTPWRWKDGSLAFRHDEERCEAADEIERLRATLNSKPTPEAILLQARPPGGGAWVDIFPAQLGWMAKEGFDVRALDADEQHATGEKT